MGCDNQHHALEGFLISGDLAVEGGGQCQCSLGGVIDRCETGDDFLHADILRGV